MDHVVFTFQVPFAIQPFEFVLGANDIELLADFRLHLAHEFRRHAISVAVNQEFRAAVLATDMRGVIGDPQCRPTVDATGIDEVHGSIATGEAM
jgi:hypothetical protein